MKDTDSDSDGERSNLKEWYNILTSERASCKAEFMPENPANKVSAWFSSYR